MTEETPVKPVGKVWQRLPSVRTVLVVLLVIACIVEGFYLYIKTIESRGSTAMALNKINSLERELDGYRNSFELYRELMGYRERDFPAVQERIRKSDPQPPTVQGYVSYLENRLQQTLTELEGYRTRQEMVENARKKAVQEAVDAQTKLDQRTTEFQNQLTRLSGLLEAEKKAREEDKKLLNDRLADLQTKLDQKDAEYNDVVRKHNTAVAELDKAKEDYRLYRQMTDAQRDRLVLLLAQALNTPPPPGINPNLLTLYRVDTTVNQVNPHPDGGIYVSLNKPTNVDLNKGMRFVIRGKSGELKALVEVKNVRETDGLATVIGWYGDPSRSIEPGDVAELHLGFEEVRRGGRLTVPTP